MDVIYLDFLKYLFDYIIKAWFFSQLLQKGFTLKGKINLQVDKCSVCVSLPFQTEDFQHARNLFANSSNTLLKKNLCFSKLKVYRQIKKWGDDVKSI